MRKKSSSHAKTTAESAYYLALTQTDIYCFQNVTGEYHINRQLTSKHDSKKIDSLPPPNSPQGQRKHHLGRQIS